MCFHIPLYFLNSVNDLLQVLRLNLKCIEYDRLNYVQLMMRTVPAFSPRHSRSEQSDVQSGNRKSTVENKVRDDS